MTPSVPHSGASWHLISGFCHPELGNGTLQGNSWCVWWGWLGDQWPCLGKGSLGPLLPIHPVTRERGPDEMLGLQRGLWETDNPGEVGPGPMMADRAGEGSWLPAGAGKGPSSRPRAGRGTSAWWSVPMPCGMQRDPGHCLCLSAVSFPVEYACGLCVCANAHTYTYSLSRSAFSLTKGVGDPGGMGAQSPLARQLEA